MPSITLTTSLENIGQLNLVVDAPIGIIGAEGVDATATNNQLYHVESTSDGDIFGEGNIADAIDILQRYGCKNLYVIQVAEGVDTAATVTNIIGADNAGVKTGLELFKETYTKYREKIDFLLVPYVLTDTLVASAISLAVNQNALYFADFPLGTSVATAQTTRDTDVGLGTKSDHLVPCMPQVYNGAVQESLAVHSVGAIAQRTQEEGFGFAPTGQILIGVTSVEPRITLDYDAGSSNNTLVGEGILSVNVAEDNYILWGNKNASKIAGEDTDIDGYISAIRVSHVMSRLLLDRLKRHVGEPITESNILIIETDLTALIHEKLSEGQILYNSYVKYNSALSDIPNRVLHFDAVLYHTLSPEAITLNLSVSGV